MPSSTLIPVMPSSSTPLGFGMLPTAVLGVRDTQDALLIVADANTPIAHVRDTQDALLIVADANGPLVGVRDTQDALLIVEPIPSISPCGPGFVQLIGGSFQDNEGNPLADGYLLMQLSQDAQAQIGGFPSGQICSRIKVKVPLDSNGNVQGTPGDNLGPICVWPNSGLAPTGTTYAVWAYTADGQLAWGPQYLTVTGTTTFNCNTWTPMQ
jgi:hypothetical protein